MPCGVKNAFVSAWLQINVCWITSGGPEIVNVMKYLDHEATVAKNGLPHHLETFHIPCMLAFRSNVSSVSWAGYRTYLVFTSQEAKYGSKSMHITYGFKND